MEHFDSFIHNGTKLQGQLCIIIILKISAYIILSTVESIIHLWENE